MRASEELWAEDITAGMVWLRGVAISPAVDTLVRVAPPNGVGASKRTVVLGQDAGGLPGVAGLTHADFRTGEPVGAACIRLISESLL